MSPSASKLVRVAVQGAALEPCAGVTPGPQEANPSDQPAPADGPCDEGGASDALPSSSLPEGWPVAYAGVLRRAQKPESLMRYAAEFWKQNGGWPKHRDGPDGATAVAIFDVFRGNFGNKDAIEELLRELV